LNPDGLAPILESWHGEVMAKGSSSKRDFMQIAREVVEQAIGEHMDGSPLERPTDIRNPRFVALGSMGGRKGGKARARTLTPQQRSAIARKAAKARWKRPHNPQK
jgi:hypothetical protein